MYVVCSGEESDQYSVNSDQLTENKLLRSGIRDFPFRGQG